MKKNQKFKFWMAGLALSVLPAVAFAQQAPQAPQPQKYIDLSEDDLKKISKNLDLTIAGQDPDAVAKLRGWISPAAWTDLGMQISAEHSWTDDAGKAHNGFRVQIPFEKKDLLPLLGTDVKDKDGKVVASYKLPASCSVDNCIRLNGADNASFNLKGQKDGKINLVWFDDRRSLDPAGTWTDSSDYSQDFKTKATLDAAAAAQAKIDHDTALATKAQAEHDRVAKLHSNLTQCLRTDPDGAQAIYDLLAKVDPVTHHDNLTDLERKNDPKAIESLRLSKLAARALHDKIDSLEEVKDLVIAFMDNHPPAVDSDHPDKDQIAYAERAKKILMVIAERYTNSNPAKPSDDSDERLDKWQLAISTLDAAKNVDCSSCASNREIDKRMDDYEVSQCTDMASMGISGNPTVESCAKDLKSYFDTRAKSENCPGSKRVTFSFGRQKAPSMEQQISCTEIAQNESLAFGNQMMGQPGVLQMAAMCGEYANQGIQAPMCTQQSTLFAGMQGQMGPMGMMNQMGTQRGNGSNFLNMSGAGGMPLVGMTPSAAGSSLGQFSSMPMMSTAMMPSVQTSPYASPTSAGGNFWLGGQFGTPQYGRSPLGI